MNAWTRNVSEADFEAQVLDQSHKLPVLVDFWAPWCGPCRILGPILERLSEEFQGAFLLAKVNVDENQGLAELFRIQGIPAVKLFKEGRIATEFSGAAPENAIRELLARFLPSEADNRVQEARRLEESGDLEKAKILYGQVLEEKPNHPGALLGMGRLLSETDEAQALGFLERIPLDSEERTAANPLIARVKLRPGGDEDEPQLRSRLQADPANVQAHFELAQFLAGKERYEEALAEFLWVVRQDRNYRDEGARKAMLQIFEILGAGNKLVDKYRSELAKILYS